MVRYIFLLVFLLAVGPLYAAELKSAALTTEVISTERQADQFDEDFADDFDSDFSGSDNLDEILISDPIERVNRGVFWFNDKLYFYMIKPVARGYRLILPRQARVSVSNAFSNVAMPVRATNSLLQLKFRTVATEIYRFLVNSTVGLGGLFDPAASVAGIEKVEEDFGQTLGYYGAGHGFYLMLPVIGPSSLRDSTGGLVDTFADPFRYFDLTNLEYLGAKTVKVINALSLDRDTYEGIVRDSIDPYLFVRAAYVQRRAALVGKVDYDILTFDGEFLENGKLNPFKWLGIE